MKKFLSLALALTMALTLAACGGKTDTPPADTNDGSTAGQTGGKLVVYSALNEDNTIAGIVTKTSVARSVAENLWGDSK